MRGNRSRRSFTNDNNKAVPVSTPDTAATSTTRKGGRRSDSAASSEVEFADVDGGDSDLDGERRVRWKGSIDRTIRRDDVPHPPPRPPASSASTTLSSTTTNPSLPSLPKSLPSQTSSHHSSDPSQLKLKSIRYITSLIEKSVDSEDYGGRSRFTSAHDQSNSHFGSESYAPSRNMLQNTDKRGFMRTHAEGV